MAIPKLIKELSMTLVAATLAEGISVTPDRDKCKKGYTTTLQSHQ